MRSPSLASVSRSWIYRERNISYTLANSSVRKRWRWPLVLRFHEGALYGGKQVGIPTRIYAKITIEILTPMIAHSLLAALAVFVNKHIDMDLSLPSSILPSLSLVVGLMLVFRVQTAHARFGDGRLHFNTVTTSVRNLSRQILVLSPAPLAPRRQSDPETSPISDQDQEEVSTKPDLQRVSSRSDPVLQNLGLKCHSSSHDQQRISDDFKASWKEMSEQISVEEKERLRIREVETAKVKETVKILIAIMYAMKSHLRTDGGVVLSSGTWLFDDRQMTSDVEYRDLLPGYLKSNEDKGLALVLQLVVFVEAFIALGVAKEWFHSAAAASMSGQLNNLVAAYSNMEVIRLTPIPVAHLIHHRQTLCLFLILLTYAMGAEMGWWAVPLITFVCFTLYGIEGIAQHFEDPFGLEKANINMEDIIKDSRKEVEVLLSVWTAQSVDCESGAENDAMGVRTCRMFVPREVAGMNRDVDTFASRWQSPVKKIGRDRTLAAPSSVRWAGSEDLRTGDKDISPCECFRGGSRDTAERETGIEANRIGVRNKTWASFVGDDDLGVFTLNADELNSEASGS